MAKRGKKAEKLYYKIGEACKLVDIQPYVLRYWETEFAALKPNKSRSGQRVYSDKEIAVIRRIKQLLYEEGFRIAGARKQRREAKRSPDTPGPQEDVPQLAMSFDGLSDAERLRLVRDTLRDVLGLVRELGTGRGGAKRGKSRAREAEA